MSRLSRQRWTYCGVMAVPGFSLLLVNIPMADGKRTTRAIVGYTDAEPVRIEVLP